MATVRKHTRHLLERLRIYASSLFKGRYKLIMTTNQRSTKVLQVTTVYNYEIEIFCQESKFTIHYDRAWVPNTRYSVFKLWGSGDGNCPPELAKALSTEVFIPRFFSDSLSEEATGKYMSGAFLDIIFDRISSAYNKPLDTQAF